MAMPQKKKFLFFLLGAGRCFVLKQARPWGLAGCLGHAAFIFFFFLGREACCSFFFFFFDWANWPVWAVRRECHGELGP